MQKKFLADTHRHTKNFADTHDTQFFFRYTLNRGLAWPRKQSAEFRVTKCFPRHGTLDFHALSDPEWKSKRRSTANFAARNLCWFPSNLQKKVTDKKRIIIRFSFVQWIMMRFAADGPIERLLRFLLRQKKIVHCEPLGVKKLAQTLVEQLFLHSRKQKICVRCRGADITSVLSVLFCGVCGA